MRRAVLLFSAMASASALVLTTTAAAGTSPTDGPTGPFMRHLTTFTVAGEVAEILAVTPDGRTLVYTDSAAEEIGLVDLTRARRPRQVAVVPMSGEPTSVAVTKAGRFALVSIDTSESYADPSGSLAVVHLRTRRIVVEHRLAGQPDAVAVSPDRSVAAVAIENQRDEEAVVGGVEGGLPQPPAGHLAVIGLAGRPSSWTVDTVDLTDLGGSRFPRDPEPEFVDINADRIAAVTLQENNAVVLVDLETRRAVTSFSAGRVVRRDADVVDDGEISFTDPLRAPREPDAVQWTPRGRLLTADEGDLAPLGARTWTIFSQTGSVRYSSAGSAERALARAGFYPDDRSDNRGAEFEGAEVATFFGRPYAFIGSERGDAVLVYDIRNESSPRLVQVVATGDAPEGLLAVRRQRLFLTSNEDDGTISVFRMGTRH